MARALVAVVGSALAAAGLMVAASGTAQAGPPEHGAASDQVVYDSLPSVSPPTNYASLGFEATQTYQFGDAIHLAQGFRDLQTITVTMSDWAKYSDYAADPAYAGNDISWSYPITVNVYSSHLNADGVPDQLLATITQTVDIPWRPETNPCGPTTGGNNPGWTDSNGNCEHGLAFDATFDFSGLHVTLPNDIIVGIAFDTRNYGAAPTGVPGPYDSLNVAVPDDQAVSVGSDESTDAVYWDSTYPGNTAGFRESTGWTPNGTVALQVTTGNPAGSFSACFSGGWRAFADPSFANQGQCVSYFARQIGGSGH